MTLGQMVSYFCIPSITILILQYCLMLCLLGIYSRNSAMKALYRCTGTGMQISSPIGYKYVFTHYQPCTKQESPLCRPSQTLILTRGLQLFIVDYLLTLWTNLHRLLDVVSGFQDAIRSSLFLRLSIKVDCITVKFIVDYNADGRPILTS